MLCKTMHLRAFFLVIPMVMLILKPIGNIRSYPWVRSDLPTELGLEAVLLNMESELGSDTWSEWCCKFGTNFNSRRSPNRPSRSTRNLTSTVIPGTDRSVWSGQNLP